MMSAARQIKTEEVSIPLPHLSASERDVRNLILASKAREWESSVSSLSDMASVLASIVEGAIGHASNLHEDPDTYFINSDQIRQIFFCVFQSQRMIDAFKDDFFAALEA